MEALLDNDLLHKLARYGLLQEFERLLALRKFDDPHKRVGSAPYSLKTIPGRVSASLWPDASQAEVLRKFLQERSAGATGASADELRALNVRAFDAGELELVAYALDHPLSMLFTGDKRAIKAVFDDPKLADVKARMSGRFMHLETVMRDLSNRLGWTRVAAAVLPAPGVDPVLTAAYSQATERAMDTALSTSIAALRAAVPALLVSGTP